MRQRDAAHEHVARRLPQAGAAAVRASPHPQVALQVFAHHGGVGFLVAALHVGDHALKGKAPPDEVAPVVGVAEVDALAVAAVQNRFAVLALEAVERRFNIEIVVVGQGFHHVEVIDVAPVPTADGAVGQGLGRFLHHQLRVEVLLHAQAVAGGAGAGRIVEGEHARFQLADAVAAHRAGEARGKHQFLGLCIVHAGHPGDAFGKTQGGLERLRQALRSTRLNAQPVHHGVDAVLLVLVQRRWVVEIGHQCVDAGADEAAGQQFLEHVHVLALAVDDHRRQHHDA